VRTILLVIASVIGAFVLVVVGWTTVSLRAPKELRDRKLDQRVTVDLSGVGSVALPPTFRKAGIVNSGDRQWFGGETTRLEYHLDQRLLSFRFQQGQHTRIGGISAYPVLLDVTLFNDGLSSAEISLIERTTIDIFYAESGKSRLSDVAWRPDSVEDGATTRLGAVSKSLSTDDVPRWLAIHVDPARRVRVDFFAWQKVYSADEVRRLVREVAASVKTTPALQAHFEGIKTFDQRMEARRDSALSAATATLAPCGVTEIVAGRATFGSDCVVHLTANRRFLTVARYLGQVPVAAASRQAGQRPVFTFAFKSGDFEGRGSTDGRPNLDIHMFYWDAEKKVWSADGLQTFVSEPFGADEERATAAILERLGTSGEAAREGVYLWSFAHFDVLFRGDEVSLEPFLARARAYEDGLGSARIIAGVKATKGALP
jgi:hypothetical protein